MNYSFYLVILLNPKILKLQNFYEFSNYNFFFLNITYFLIIIIII